MKLSVALGHPSGRRILRIYDAQERALSPQQVAESSGLPLAEVERHILLLHEGGALKAARSNDDGPRTYRSALDGSAEWVRKVLDAANRSDSSGTPE